MSVKFVVNPGFVASVRAAANAGLTAAAMALADGMTRTFGSNHGGVTSLPGMPPNSQTGNLRGSIGYTKAENLEAQAGTDVKYGAYLEKGAIIRPKNGKAIVIPLSRAAAKLLRDHGGRARSVVNALKFDRAKPLRFIKTKNGLLIARAYGITKGKAAGTKSEPMFLVTKRAVIKPRPWLRPAYIRSLPQMKINFVRAAKAAGGVP